MAASEYTQAELKLAASQAARVDAIREGVKVAKSAAPTWTIRIHESGRVQLVVQYHDTLGNPGETTVAI